ncbi:hypothetical protein [Aestuariivivens sediminis]|uniref:hypothetical protein n=1 Tax=Aestuariivivens sediminis TaxID=2913557 RepID=UPI001F566B24|nr:hypothetical protein [Aestuariivivens sediminis]
MVPRLLENVEIAGTYLPEVTYLAAMIDFVKSKYKEGLLWEEAFKIRASTGRDSDNPTAI